MKTATAKWVETNYGSWMRHYGPLEVYLSFTQRTETYKVFFTTVEATHIFSVASLGAGEYFEDASERAAKKAADKWVKAQFKLWAK